MIKSYKNVINIEIIGIFSHDPWLVKKEEEEEEEKGFMKNFIFGDAWKNFIFIVC